MELSPNVVVIVIIAVVGIPVLVLLFVALKDIFGMAKEGVMQSQVLETGESARATILKVWETGAAVGSVNPDPQLGMLLKVQPTNAPTFQTQADVYVKVWDVPQFSVGAIVNVKYDPKDTRRVAVEGLA